jgi:hypothetical protein
MSELSLTSRPPEKCCRPASVDQKKLNLFHIQKPWNCRTAFATYRWIPYLFRHNGVCRET